MFGWWLYTTTRLYHSLSMKRYEYGIKPKNKKKNVADDMGAPER